MNRGNSHFFLQPTLQQQQQQQQQHEQEPYPVHQRHTIHGNFMQECGQSGEVDGSTATMEKAESKCPQQENTQQSAEHVHGISVGFLCSLFTYHNCVLTLGILHLNQPEWELSTCQLSVYTYVVECGCRMVSLFDHIHILDEVQYLFINYELFI